MNIQTVAENLRNTIAGKEKLLSELELDKTAPGWAVAQMVKINIAELNRILDDVVECSITGVELSWRANPDRMGVQFTQDEIDRSSGWQ